MISAFGVEHGEIYQISKRERSSKERSDHYGRMRNSMGTLGATSGALAAGSGVVGAMERKGKDPMGFTERRAASSKPLSSAARARRLGVMANAHGWQAKTLGGLSAASLGLAGAYQAKKKNVSKREQRTRGDRASQAGLAVGAAGVGGVGAHQGFGHGKMLAEQSKHGVKEGMIAHHALAGKKWGAWDMDPKEEQFARKMRKVGGRIVGLKGTGAVGSGVAAAAGGAAAYELGRHHLGRKKR